MKTPLYVAALATSFIVSTQAHAAISCKADVGMFVPGSTATVQITDETQNKVSGSYTVNDVKTEIKNATVTEFAIRQGIGGIETADDMNLNQGEKRISLLQTYLADEEMKKAVKLEVDFKISDVATVRIYDINGDAFTNQMGGSPLVELKDASGKVLGRFIQSLALINCK